MTSLTSLVTQMIQELFQRGSNFTAVPICSTLFIQCALLSMFVTKTNKQHQKKKIINEKKKNKPFQHNTIPSFIFFPMTCTLFLKTSL